MKFRKHGSSLAISECGDYEIRISIFPPTKKEFYNVYHVPSGRSIHAGMNKAEALAKCVEYRHKLVSRETIEVA